MSWEVILSRSSPAVFTAHCEQCSSTGFWLHGVCFTIRGFNFEAAQLLKNVIGHNWQITMIILQGTSQMPFKCKEAYTCQNITSVLAQWSHYYSGQMYQTYIQALSWCYNVTPFDLLCLTDLSLLRKLGQRSKLAFYYIISTTKYIVWEQWISWCCD